MSERLIDHADAVWNCPSLDQLEAEVNGESFVIVPEDDQFSLFDSDGFRCDRGTIERCKETFSEMVNEYDPTPWEAPVGPGPASDPMPWNGR